MKHFCFNILSPHAEYSGYNRVIVLVKYFGLIMSVHKKVKYEYNPRAMKLA